MQGSHSPPGMFLSRTCSRNANTSQKKVTAPGTGFDLVTIDVDKYPELAGEFKVSDGLPRRCSSMMSTIQMFPIT